MNFSGRDLLKIEDFSEAELRYMLDTAHQFKKMKRDGANHKYFPNKNIVIVFEKTSTRTRCAFEVAGYDLGMGVTYLDPTGSQMGHKESIADTEDNTIVFLYHAYVYGMILFIILRKSMINYIP